MIFSFCAILAAGRSVVVAQEGEPATPARIGTIQIVTLDVFSPAEAANGWIYRAANAVHIETHKSTIRRFLLFREGDPYDPAKLAETERNLRAQAFIKSATITAGPEHDGVVDVVITTQDTWTTEPGASFGSKGGTTTYGFSFDEKNLLGTGRKLSFAYDKGTERTTRSFSYEDPFLFGPYWLGEVTYAINSDGREESVGIQRPFYSFTTPWETAGSFDRLIENERIFRDGATFSKFQQRHRLWKLEYGRAILATEDHARRWTVGVESLDDDFANIAGRPGDPLPDRRRFRYLVLGFEDARNDFVKANYVNRDLRFEDFNLGAHLAAKAGVSPAAFGPDHNTAFAQLSLARGFRLGISSVLLAQAAYSSRFDGGPQNEIVSAGAFYFRKFDTRIRQTLVGRVEYDRGWRLDRDMQFFADGQTGLRAYHLYSFEGNKRVMLNVEDRLFSGREILQLVAPGAAAFVDIGDAEPPGKPLSLSHLKGDAGIGLRLGIARAPSNNVFRLDVAYAFNHDPRGRHGLLISFSSSQAF
jgi:hypothetical protein